MEISNIQEINIDLTLSSYKTIKVKQYDKNTRKIKIVVTDNGKIFPITDEIYMLIKLRTPTKKYYQILDEDIVVENGYIIITLNDSITANFGKNSVEISLYEDAEKTKSITTMTFYILIEKSVWYGEEVKQDQQYDVLTSLIMQTEHLYDMFQDKYFTEIRSSTIPDDDAQLENSYWLKPIE